MNNKILFIPLKLNLKEAFLLFFLICAAGFSTVIQLITLIIFSFFFLFFTKNVRLASRWFFYISLTSISGLQLFLFWKDDYNINFILNTVLITLMWFLALQSSNIVIKSVFEIRNSELEKILKIVFKINLIIGLVQIAIMCFEMKTLFPFSSMSAGDNVKGIFRNSSVNMIIMSFYTIFYLYKKEYKYMILAIVVMVLTFYMSGLVLFAFVLCAFVFFVFTWKIKIKILFGLLLTLFLFSKISPDNVNYVKEILVDKLQSPTEMPRKLISFKQTFDFWVDNPHNFIFGAGGGKFSSRVAFITGGEYVSWYPQEYAFVTSDFKSNHFSLWNKEILSIPYNDGTSNQPFSFYNKIIGEYGLIGIILFSFYLYAPIKYYKVLTYGKILLLLIFVYFLLDYWFEYFSVILFLEMFLYLDIKNYLINKKGYEQP